jgi:hypothetical protein
VLAGAWVFAWWTANKNNIAPTAIDGVWHVESPAAVQPTDFTDVFFEHNRAHMAVFRSTNGVDAVHHFEVDDARHVRVWYKWLQKGDLLMTGDLVAPDRIELRPSIGPALRLRRVSGPLRPAP